MIGPDVAQDVFAALVWSALCFVVGVVFAVYRAVGWVARMRAWADSESLT